MTNRREILQIGITATAWPLASKAARAAGADLAAMTSLPIYKVIYDTRFAESVVFAERAKALGLPVYAIQGDMTRFWYYELYHEWKQGPIAIAGLTAHGPLFCFDQLGRDQGMRVVFKAKHAQPRPGMVAHELSGPLHMLRACETLRDDGARWSHRMADVIGQCPQGKSEISSATAASATDAWSATGDDDALYSWVIAPAQTA